MIKKYDLKNWDELKNYLHGYAKQDKILQNNYLVSKKEKVKAGLKFLQLILDPTYTNFYRNYGRSLFNSFFMELKFSIQTNLRKRYANKKFIRKNKFLMKKFVYFPLQLEPETDIISFCSVL